MLEEEKRIGGFEEERKGMSVLEEEKEKGISIFEEEKENKEERGKEQNSGSLSPCSGTAFFLFPSSLSSLRFKIYISQNTFSCSSFLTIYLWLG